MRVPTILFALAASATAQNALTDYLGSQPDLSTLLGALSSVPDLVQTLVKAGPNLTILAPTNEAFAAVPADSDEGTAIASGDKNGISAILAYHVLGGTYLSGQIEETANYVPSLLSPNFTLAGVPATNATAGQNVGLVLNGSDVDIISGELMASRVLQADINVGGFTIHKIDKVLTIPPTLSATALEFNLTAAAGALIETDLIGTLDDVQDLTIFVPNNEAFQIAGSAFADASVETLKSVLQYHAVVGSVVFSQDISNGTVLPLSGQPIVVNVIDGSIFLNQAKVVLPNVLLANGVAHVIDTVLNPGLAPPAPANLVPTRSAAPAFVGASSVADVPFTSAIPAPSTTMSVPAMATTASMVGNGTMSSMSISGSVMASGSMTAGGSTMTGGSATGTTSSSAGPATYTGGAAVSADTAGGFLLAAAAVGAYAMAM